MANDLDTFVLQYTVELKDSISRLEKLQHKMDGVEKGSSKAAKGFSTFATGAAGELDRMIPGLSKVADVVKGLGAEFALAATAVTALGVGVKAVMDLRNQVNGQSTQSLITGLSIGRTEDLTRKLSLNGGDGTGKVDREAAAAGLQSFMEKANDAYRTRDTGKLFQLQSIGVNPFGPNGASTSPMEMLSSAAGKLSSVSPDQADALLRGAGIDINWGRSLRKTGATGVMNNGLSADETKAYESGSDNVSKLNKDLQDFHNQVNQLDTSLGELTIGPLAEFLKMINGTMSEMAGTTAKNNPGKRFKTEVTPEGQVIQVEDTSPVPVADAGQKKKAQDAANDAIRAQESAAASNLAAQNKQAQLVNLFASAVSSFGNSTVNVAQAWAAWAGEIGKAGGLNGSSNAPVTGGNSGSKGLRNFNPGNLEAGAFATAHGATGTDGRFAIFPNMQSGVDAHAALLEQNYYAKGLDTPRKVIGKYAPASENNQGAYLAYLKQKGFDPDKAITDKAGFNNAQMAYESGYGSGHGSGQSKDSLMLTSVQSTIAGALGIPLIQLQQGKAGRKDVEFTIAQQEAGYLNSANQARVRLQNPVGLSPIQVGEFKNQLLTATRSLSAMETYKKQIIGSSNGTLGMTSGVRNVTMAAPTVNIIVQGGNMNEQKIAEEVNKILMGHVEDAKNHFINHEKG